MVASVYDTFILRCPSALEQELASELGFNYTGEFWLTRQLVLKMRI